MQVGRPKLALDQLWAPLELMTAAMPALCSPHWRTELAFQEEGGLAPMFRAVLEGRTHNLANLCVYIDKDRADPRVIPDFPRIKAGRCGLLTTRLARLSGRAGTSRTCTDHALLGVSWLPVHRAHSTCGRHPGGPPRHAGRERAARAHLTCKGLCRYQGYSPVLFAAARGLLVAVSFLITSLHGSLEDRTPDGSTVLHLLMDNWRGSPELSNTEDSDGAKDKPGADGSCEVCRSTLGPPEALHACCPPACGELCQLWRAERVAVLQAVVSGLMASWERELGILLRAGDGPIPTLVQRLVGVAAQAEPPSQTS